MSESNKKRWADFSMIGFARKYFRKLFTIFLWIIAIAATIGGLGMGAAGGFAAGEEIGGDVLGVILMIVGAPIGGVLGWLVGLFLVIQIGGFMATFLEMGENLQYLADKEKAKE